MSDVTLTDEGFEQAACGLLTLSPAGTIEQVNRATCSWVGHDREQLLGKRLTDLLSIGSKLFYQTHWLPLLQLQGSVAEVQVELALADGTKLPALMNGARRADGKIDIAIFTTVDRRKYERELLLARRHAEELIEELRQREAEFRAIAENSPDVMVRLTRDGRCTYISPAVSKVTGRDPSEIIGRRLDEVGLGEDGEELARRVDGAVAGESSTYAFDRPLTDGRVVHLELLFVPERRSDGQVATVLLIARDMTAARDREREAEQRARFAEQLVGIVSHDLRNPLNAILLGTQLLAGEDLGANARIVQRIASAANRANRLTSELLDFTQARLGGGLRVNRVEVALHAVVGETVEELRLAWPKRALEHQRVGAGPAFADPDRLAQVVTNLVGNAMTYGDPARAVRVTSFVEEQTLGLEVHNEGRAIPPDLQRQIFEPLRRGDEQVQRGSRSVGLGLYIVREIAQAHGGDVTVTSSPESGTTFRVTLPRVSSPGV